MKLVEFLFVWVVMFLAVSAGLFLIVCSSWAIMTVVTAAAKMGLTAWLAIIFFVAVFSGLWSLKEI